MRKATHFLMDEDRPEDISAQECLDSILLLGRPSSQESCVSLVARTRGLSVHTARASVLWPFSISSVLMGNVTATLCPSATERSQTSTLSRCNTGAILSEPEQDVGLLYPEVGHHRSLCRVQIGSSRRLPFVRCSCI